MQAFELRLFFTQEGLDKLSELQMRTHPPLIRREDLFGKSLVLYESVFNATRYDGQLVYDLPDDPGVFYPVSSPFGLDREWEMVDSWAEKDGRAIPLVLEIVPPVVEQIHRIAKKIPHLPGVTGVVSSSLSLFDQFVRGTQEESKKFFIYRKNLRVADSIPFPFWKYLA